MNDINREELWEAYRRMHNQTSLKNKENIPKIIVPPIKTQAVIKKENEDDDAPPWLD